jgi:hypothetical protein
MLNKGQHSWVVYATDLRHGVLLCRCIICDATGSITEPSSQEWEKAFYAHQKPYRWPHNERVTAKSPKPSDNSRNFDHHSSDFLDPTS